MGICKRCKQLFYIELQNRQFRENRSAYKLSNLSNSQGSSRVRACARDKDLYSYYIGYIGEKSLCIFMR